MSTAPIRVRRTEIVGTRRDIIAIGGCDGGFVNYVVGRVGFRGATVGGDVAGAGALQDTDVAILEPGTGVLAEDEVTGLKIGC